MYKSKMIFPSQIRGYGNRMQPTKGCSTENKRAQINKWRKLAKDVKGKTLKRRAGCAS